MKKQAIMAASQNHSDLAELLYRFWGNEGLIIRHAVTSANALTLADRINAKVAIVHFSLEDGLYLCKALKDDSKGKIRAYYVVDSEEQGQEARRILGQDFEVDPIDEIFTKSTDDYDDVVDSILSYLEGLDASKPG